MKTLSTLIILFSLQTMVSQVIIGGVPERDADGNPIFKAMLEIRNPPGDPEKVTKSGVLIPRYASNNLPSIPTTVADDPDTEADETVNLGWDDDLQHYRKEIHVCLPRKMVPPALVHEI